MGQMGHILPPHQKLQNKIKNMKVFGKGARFAPKGKICPIVTTKNVNSTIKLG